MELLLVHHTVKVIRLVQASLWEKTQNGKRCKITKMLKEKIYDILGLETRLGLIKRDNKWSAFLQSLFS